MSREGGGRRVRVTIRCLIEDLRYELPGLEVDIGGLDHPAIAEARRLAPTSPTGQKRILAIEYPMVYRLRHSRWRGATWVEDETGIVWLLSVAEREEGSPDDAFGVFEGLHRAGVLLPVVDDRLRDRAEGANRLATAIERDAPAGLQAARSRRGQELRWIIAGRIEVLMFVRASEGFEEVWLAVPDRDRDGENIPYRVRDVIFVAFERAVGTALWEQRFDWPTRRLERYEMARLYLREA